MIVGHLLRLKYDSWKILVQQNNVKCNNLYEVNKPNVSEIRGVCYLNSDQLLNFTKYFFFNACHINYFLTVF